MSLFETLGVPQYEHQTPNYRSMCMWHDCPNKATRVCPKSFYHSDLYLCDQHAKMHVERYGKGHEGERLT